MTTMDPLICYLTVLTTQNAPAGTYTIQRSQAHQLASQAGLFRALFAQYAHTAPPSSPPVLQTALPSAQTFDILLHWFYHHDMGAVHKAIATGVTGANSSADVFFGIVRNAVHVGVEGKWADALWDVLAAWCAANWVSGAALRDCVKWTWTVVPVALAARAAIAVGGGGVGGDMMSKWASGDASVAERAVQEVRNVLEMYRAPPPPLPRQSHSEPAGVPHYDYYDNDDDAATAVGDDEGGEDLGGFAVFTPSESMSTLNNVEARKKRKGLLSKFKNMMIKEENKLVATVVIVRDAQGNIVDERVMRH
ncbi:hypothetical protein DFJ77DRAFT_466806 [Powellomyces hirtus]|nr:hypothetical protein DFJ77DRAFT_466806 [Powellomyces hirtus]